MLPLLHYQNLSSCLIFQNYEARIDALQRQVDEQSMTMSMYSTMTSATEDSHQMLQSYMEHDYEEESCNNKMSII